jgi:hypothetical protein
MSEVYYQDFRTDGCPTDSSHLIGDDIAELLDRGLPYAQVERAEYVVVKGACRVRFQVSLAQTLKLGYTREAYCALFARNQLTAAQVHEAVMGLVTLGLDKKIAQHLRIKKDCLPL